MGYVRLESPYLYHKKGKGKEGNRERKENKKKRKVKEKAFTQILQWEVGVVGGEVEDREARRF